MNQRIAKTKIITNGDNELKNSVREELLRAFEDPTLRKRMRYILAVHQERTTIRSVEINKNI